MTSNLCCLPSRMSGMTTTASANDAIPIGRLTKKIHPQPQLVTMMPPRVGPAAAASPAMAPHTPNAAPRRPGGKIWVRIDNV